MNQKVVLVHGYNKNSNDMKVLKRNLEKIGYKGVVVDLPLTYKEIEYCAFVFEGIIYEIIKNLKPNEKINIVGHSTGGLIIRHLLSTSKYISKINKCVLVATPNNGSELADIAGNMSKILINIFKTLKSLQCQEVKALKLENSHEIEIGAIAGNRNNLFLGYLLSDENDGRVTVKSVKFAGLKDFVVLPYGHKEIHYMWETARLIDTFIKTGKFI
ncbi:alpha/beta fold hydrolase [Anaeromicrobium sediminis]|uniref:Alpha/beta hydrolase n=1 Tax=Anaeromicrobium sediminis TaxID=1478221 RepID=A0A267MN89_9FIRM|nr:alpha/beta fold hydrolase [Anaeromicrobium sediminis]PAB60996.1 alpha/beta hydrolase [Anaeromicrobium sediminis]